MESWSADLSIIPLGDLRPFFLGGSNITLAVPSSLAPGLVPQGSILKEFVVMRC
jgi:hypothetical protein